MIPTPMTAEELDDYLHEYGIASAVRSFDANDLPSDPELRSLHSRIMLAVNTYAALETRFIDRAHELAVEES